MFSDVFKSWFSNNKRVKPSVLFEDEYAVYDLETVEWNNRTELGREGYVRFFSNIHQALTRIFYEVVFIKKKQFIFLVYHSWSRDEAQLHFDSCKVVLNEFDKYLTGDKLAVQETLHSIMGCLRINPKWTCAHICARIGFDAFFSERRLAPTIIDAQVGPDMYTPLHLAIQGFHLSTLKLILAHSPNLDLLSARHQSVLHYAAISTQEIAIIILCQPGMFDRILWKDSKGCTALHLACYIQKFDIVFEFLKFGLTVRMLTLSPPRSTVKVKDNPAMNKIVKFSEQDFDDIDCQDIYSGGTPLHWVKHKRLVEKLLKYSFPLNARNGCGNTPLHVVAKRLRLKCVIALLCAGADVNSINIFGNTPLHLSVKENDLVVPQTLIVFDANIDAKNFNNESVRHVAAKACKSMGNETILYLLSALGAKRCPPTNDETLCNIGCSNTGNFEGNICEKLYGVDQKYDRLYKDFLFGDLIKQNLARLPEQTKKQNCVNLLCLDGGGVKGLVTIQMLKEIDRYLKHPLHHYFKWYAGTSTGSFISTFLAMGKSLNEIRAVYFRLKDKVLTGPKPYSSESFEKILKEIMGEHLKMDDVRTKYGKYLMIPSAIANRRPMKLHMFRSFPSPEEMFEESGQKHLIDNFLPDRDKELRNAKKYESRNVEVWKACRSSGAAPTYFRAYNDYLDGGLVSNNPTLDALSEFQQYNCALRAMGRGEECQKLDLCLSIGTGRGLLEAMDMPDISSYYSLTSIRQLSTLINLFIYEICQTEQHIQQRAESFCSAANVPYFRLNSFLSEIIELDEQHDYKIIQCLWETKRFMYYRRDQVKVLVEYLEKCTLNLPPTTKRIVRNIHKRSSTTAGKENNEPIKVGSKRLPSEKDFSISAFKSTSTVRPAASSSSQLDASKQRENSKTSSTSLPRIRESESKTNQKS